MIGLLIRFFPLILRIVRETEDAQKSRGIDHRKNPVYRFSKLSISVLRKTFEYAEKLAEAMDARCYSETRTNPSFSFGQAEYRFIFVLSGICILMLII
jgi:energy-coupling factor transporter transmembrane protein EcfT